MHIYIVGATGRNGLIVVDEALNRGHTVTALVRNPGALNHHTNLTVIQGLYSLPALILSSTLSLCHSFICYEENMF